VYSHCWWIHGVQCWHHLAPDAQCIYLCLYTYRCSARYDPVPRVMPAGQLLSSWPSRPSGLLPGCSQTVVKRWVVACSLRAQMYYYECESSKYIFTRHISAMVDTEPGTAGRHLQRVLSSRVRLKAQWPPAVVALIARSRCCCPQH
jgi:hypothetical protein